MTTTQPEHRAQAGDFLSRIPFLISSILESTNEAIYRE
ncbi:hypothetical protein VRK_30290 [Vibrio sp. MEBiC08052]|nr:hypothetical protein VRK_30290 [Vibrio sp. MEBiC08052]